MSAPLVAVVVDDELHARDGLSALLERDGRVRVVARCSSIREATRAVRRWAPDVVFLDIEMPGGSGFEVVSEGPVHDSPLVVFVTAYEEHALRAFEVGAVDYLLKPFSDERLALAIERLEDRAREPRDRAFSRALAVLREVEAGRSTPLRRLAVRRPGKTAYLPVADVTRLRAQGDYVEVRTRAGRTELVRGPLGRLAGRLGAQGFVRTHRSWLVSLDHVVALRARAGRRAVIELTGGEEIPVSARLRSSVEAALAGRV